MSQPMQRLAHWTPGRKKDLFPWGKEQEASFEAIKALFRDTPVLRYPTPEGHFILDTDASNDSIGAALSQVQGGVEVPYSLCKQLVE